MKVSFQVLYILFNFHLEIYLNSKFIKMFVIYILIKIKSRKDFFDKYLL